MAVHLGMSGRLLVEVPHLWEGEGAGDEVPEEACRRPANLALRGSEVTNGILLCISDDRMTEHGIVVVVVVVYVWAERVERG